MLVSHQTVLKLQIVLYKGCLYGYMKKRIILVLKKVKFRRTSVKIVEPSHFKRIF